MHSSRKQPQRQRHAVLVAIHDDQYLEVFSDSNVDVHVANIPTAGSLEGERVAEDVFELLLPPRYRELYRADRLRANGNATPLSPVALRQSLATKELIGQLNKLAPVSAEGEVIEWT